MPKKKIMEGEPQETIKGLEPDEGAEQKTVSALSPKTPAEEGLTGNGGEGLSEGKESSPSGESNSFSEELKSADEETPLDQTAPPIPITEDVIPDIPEVATANLEEGASMEMSDTPDISDPEPASASETEIETHEEGGGQTTSNDISDNRGVTGESGAGKELMGPGLERLSLEGVTAGGAAVPDAREPSQNLEERAVDGERRSFYDLDFHELDRDLTPEQRQEWNSIYASYRGRNAMSGTVVGVDQHRLRVRDRKSGEMTWKQLYCAIVIPFRVRILIPETEVWMKGEERPGFVLRNLPGAKIDFVIIHVDREAGFAVGSRKLAMPSRRYYFSTQPGMNEPGSRVNCEVLVVGPRRCLVSCHGYDLDLTQRELSYTAVPDLRDMYHSGQTLGCIVKAYDREKNRLTISVKETAPNPFDGAVFRHPVQSHRQGVIAGKYGGGVFCNLPDGVTVMCNYSFHYDDSAFRTGDRVMLIIQRYDNTRKQIYGKIVAKC